MVNEMTTDSIHMQDSKVPAVQSFPVPICPDQIIQFLGLAGFYRKFIQHFRLMAQLICSRKTLNLFDLRRNKVHLINLSLPYVTLLSLFSLISIRILCTDAIGFGIGAVLMQQDYNGNYCAIAYANTLLNKAEHNYDVTKTMKIFLYSRLYATFLNSFLVKEKSTS